MKSSDEYRLISVGERPLLVISVLVLLTLSSSSAMVSILVLLTLSSNSAMISILVLLTLSSSLAINNDAKILPKLLLPEWIL